MSESVPPFRKILVANRGEIAIRIIRAAHAVGSQAIAVYSDPDAYSLHVRQADKAYRIGSGPASDSYLNVEAIIAAARTSGVEAVHPGYGFLSENADFAQAAVDAGLTFIGPSPETIRMMGDKVAAKRVMATDGLPLIPGYDGEDQSDGAFRQEAHRIGYPVIVKAAAGGGGRGMREISAPEEIAGKVESARREATAAFGDGRLFLEKLLTNPRHIEVQVLGDSYGNLIHLYERDCSVQRRHQKVIEEAPSPALNDKERLAICDAGIRAARAARYENAGTVEFLWQDGQFYFLEMNTRIQVEHGVTELATRRDLVIAQIEVASGKPIEWTQDDIRLERFAIEARLYAEDPNRGFIPQPGRLRRLEIRQRNGVRVDPGVSDGDEISRYYDPMIAKIMSFGQTRDDARQVLRDEIAHGVEIDGPTTNLAYLRWLIDTPEFKSGEATTGLTESWRGSRESLPAIDERSIVSLIAWDLNSDPAPTRRQSYRDVWTEAAGWRQGGQGVPLSYLVDGTEHRARLFRQRDGAWKGKLDGSIVELPLERGGPALSPIPGTDDDSMLAFDVAGGSVAVRRVRPGTTVPLNRGQDAVGHDGTITAPMPGSITRIYVAESDIVAAHQPLVVLEAMKMEHVLHAPHAGTVRRIHRSVGDVVTAGADLVEVVSE